MGYVGVSRETWRRRIILEKTRMSICLGAGKLEKEGG